MSTSSVITLVNGFTTDVSTIIVGVIAAILTLLVGLIGLQYGVGLFRRKITGRKF